MVATARPLYSAFTAASALQAHILQDAERLLEKNPAMPIPVHERHLPAVSNLREYHPHLTTISLLTSEPSFPTDNPTAFCTPRRRLTNNLSSSSLFDGTQSSCTNFALTQVMRHRFSLLLSLLSLSLRCPAKITSRGPRIECIYRPKCMTTPTRRDRVQ